MYCTQRNNQCPLFLLGQDEKQNASVMPVGTNLETRRFRIDTASDDIRATMLQRVFAILNASDQGEGIIHDVYAAVHACTESERGAEAQRVLNPHMQALQAAFKIPDIVGDICNQTQSSEYAKPREPFCIHSERGMLALVFPDAGEDRNDNTIIAHAPNHMMIRSETLGGAFGALVEGGAPISRASIEQGTAAFVQLKKEKNPRGILEFMADFPEVAKNILRAYKARR